MPETYRDGVGLLRCRTCQALVLAADVDQARAELGTLGRNVPPCACPAVALAREARHIFDADDPLVLNGTYDREGYKPGERERIAKARARQLKEEDTMAKKQKRKTSTKNAGTPAARQRSQSLPGMEDRAIKPLEDIAAAFADVRDRRIELNREESELKAHAIKLMHKYYKTIYRHDGIEIRLVESDEDVKVRIKKPGAEESGDTPAGADVDVEAAGDGEQADL